MAHITTVVDLGESFEQWKEAGIKVLPDLVYSSYYWQREYGMTHEQCMSIGLGKEEYNDRYNKECLT